MANLDPTAFVSKWNSLFADNTSQAISEEDLRDFSIDIRDSFLNNADITTSLSQFRGNWAGSNDAFPTTGGSGTAGAIQAGNEWFVIGEISLGGDVYNDGTIIKARTNTPGQSLGNWRIMG